MDCSKAFDCLDHEFLTTKFHIYNFSRCALDFIHRYLTKRLQRVKLNGTYSAWKETNKGVPQGSVLGPLLFNIFIYDIFFLVSGTEVCNHTTIFVCGSDGAQNKLDANANKLCKWFVDNHMKLLLLGVPC